MSEKDDLNQVKDVDEVKDGEAALRAGAGGALGARERDFVTRGELYEILQGWFLDRELVTRSMLREEVLKLEKKIEVGFAELEGKMKAGFAEMRVLIAKSQLYTVALTVTLTTAILGGLIAYMGTLVVEQLSAVFQPLVEIAARAIEAAEAAPGGG